MELFVINRHGEDKPEVTEEQERAKLDKVLQTIEKKKKLRIRQREREKQKRKQTQLEENDEEVIHEKRQKIVENNTEEISKEVPADNTTEEQQVQNSIDVKSFTILGANTVSKKTKADRVLPRWLSNPTIISSDLQSLTIKVSEIKDLDKCIRHQLKSNGIKYFFPVQATVIPFLLRAHKHKDIMFPRDICVSAPTGSGKTLAFVLPIIQALKHHTVRKIRALVILPTQDLAEQVFKAFKAYIQGTNIEAGLITGKHLFNAEQQHLGYFSESFGYISKIDILVCTAGRLVSHLKATEGFNLRSLEFLIIDEADRVLESVQDDWLYHLEKHITEDVDIQKKVLNLCALQKKRAPQKLLFSATLTQDPEKLEKLSLFQPKLFSSVTENTEKEENQVSFVGKYTTPQELTEKYVVCSKDLKPLILYKFVKKEKLTKTIVFTHSVETSHRLKILLQSLFKSKFKIEEISSSLKGKDRDNLIESFSKGEIDLLICTDFLARGIDLPGVNCVISYSAPKYLKTYIHRVGRTARAGESGLAVTLVHGGQLGAFRSLLDQMKKEIEEIQIEEGGLEKLSDKYKEALEALKVTVKREEQKNKKSVVAKKKALKK